MDILAFLLVLLAALFLLGVIPIASFIVKLILVIVLIAVALSLFAGPRRGRW